ncbi:glycosyltransferase family 2 protein [Aurantibacillus circumpalustris]|uniref:glycosyltransferase family 2 protein n=1 Tax=Aurantibacillus circumpalustris TaxID=3036359 RepID=UPI00295A97C5|nr:glycosyltransferase family 2 protein [Aurantibacillus circumpalustris]
MKISIITITFNSESTIEQTIRSVIEQTYKNIEYIIVDGGSTDNTLNVIEKYKPNIHKIVSESDNGLYDALNKGIEMATGDVIGMIHSDDFYIDNNVIQKYADCFLKNKSDSVYSDLYYVDKTNADKIIRKWKSGEYKAGSFINGWMPPHPTFFVKREIYQKLGKFNIQFKSAADYELMLRFIKKNKISISYLPEYTVKMRVGGKSNVSVLNRFKANMEDRKAWEENGLKPRFYTLYLKPLRKILQFF